MSILTNYISIFDLNEEESVVLNSLSGAIDIIDRDTKEKFSEMRQKCEFDICIFDSKLMSSLQQRGYIFENRADELKKLEELRNIHYELCGNAMLHVICPTMLCNLNCYYCFEPEHVRADPRVLNKKQLKAITDFILKVKMANIDRPHHIQLFGGEPLLPITKDINEELFNFGKVNDIPVSMITNGTHILTYKDLFIKYQNTIDSVQITLDGPKHVHDTRRIGRNGVGTFDIICDGIDFLLTTNVRYVNIRVNVDKTNIDYLSELNDFIEKKGWRENKNFYFDLAPVTDHTTETHEGSVMSESEIIEELSKSYPEYKEKRLTMFRVLSHVSREVNLDQEKKDFGKYTYCEANRGQYFVYDPYGNIYACPEAIGVEGLEVGHYDDESVTMDDNKWKQWAGRNILDIPECLDCEIAPLCGGGCAFAALKINGSTQIPVCGNNKEVLSAYIEGIKTKFLEKT